MTCRCEAYYGSVCYECKQKIEQAARDAAKSLAHIRKEKEREDTRRKHQQANDFEGWM